MADEKDPQLRVVDRRWWARGESPDSTEAPLKPSYVEELEGRLADATAQLQHMIAQHRRSLEEFEQVKARLRREVAREVERGRRTVLAELLDVLDNLDRAIHAARNGEEGHPDQTGVATFARGVALVRDQFLAKLEAFGVTRVPALGMPFDARRHEAVTTTTAANPSQDGMIVAVLKEGYAIGDEVLRPAAVVVGAVEQRGREPDRRKTDRTDVEQT